MTPAAPHPQAREADIALLLEGTFPYVSGGVSSWINQIIRAYPGYRYAIVFLGSRRSDYSGFKYELPANVVHFEEHYLYDHLSEHAMPGGGSFTISLHRTAAGMLEITASDTGHGMDVEVRERALEPFFTTKPSGQGTGLGLAVAANLIQAVGGGIVLDSAPGQGTTVRITLPLAARNLRDSSHPL